MIIFLEIQLISDKKFRVYKRNEMCCIKSFNGNLYIMKDSIHKKNESFIILNTDYYTIRVFCYKIWISGSATVILFRTIMFLFLKTHKKKMYILNTYTPYKILLCKYCYLSQLKIWKHIKLISSWGNKGK